MLSFYLTGIQIQCAVGPAPAEGTGGLRDQPCVTPYLQIYNGGLTGHSTPAHLSIVVD